MSIPQIAFWIIFPLAALIVFSGWVMILISAVRKLRSAGKQNDGAGASAPGERPGLLQITSSPEANGSPFLFE